MDDIWQHAALTLNRPTERVYEQLVDVYLQLRPQDFSKIGALGLPNDSRSTIQVCHRPISVEIILQTDEELNPTKRFKEGVCFARTSEFADALLWLAENELAKGKNPGVDIQHTSGAEGTTTDAGEPRGWTSRVRSGNPI